MPSFIFPSGADKRKTQKKYKLNTDVAAEKSYSIWENKSPAKTMYRLSKFFGLEVSDNHWNTQKKMLKVMHVCMG